MAIFTIKERRIVQSDDGRDKKEKSFRVGTISIASFHGSSLWKFTSLALFSIFIVFVVVNSMEISWLNFSIEGGQTKQHQQEETLSSLSPLIGEAEIVKNDTSKTGKEGKPKDLDISGTPSSYYHFAVNFMAGGVSGAVSKTCTAPIERVKLLIQTQDANPLILSGKVLPYKGICDCFKRVFQEQGWKSFWRGNLTNIIRYFPTQAFNFAFKDTIKALFPKVKDKKKEFWKSFSINIASGGLAGAGSLLVVYPLDYARTRLATDVGYGNTQKFKSLWHCISETYMNSGLQGLYNGIGISIIGIIPYRGVYFGLYDTLSDYNPYQHARNALARASSKFLVAQFATIMAAYASYPFDTVRRRLQMQSEIPSRDEWIYKGPVDCFVKIINDEGFLALFKGAGANTIRTIGAALVLVLYSEITAFF